jgi:hypothetical protein
MTRQTILIGVRALRRLFLVAAVLLPLLAPVEARADASCTPLVNSLVSKLTSSGGHYNFDLTMHRTDVNFVSYSAGSLALTGPSNWPLSGGANQLFSDRRNGSQPFNASAADQITAWLSSDGQLFIYYNTWRFSTQWDMACTGNAMTRLLPGFGVVTLVVRNWSAQ